jgi:hypothetical protein
MDDLSMNFLKIFWQDFKTYNIWRNSSMQLVLSFDMEDALEDFTRLIEEHKDFVLLQQP